MKNMAPSFEGGKMYITLIFNIALFIVSFLCILLMRVEQKNETIMNPKLRVAITTLSILVFIFSAYQIVMSIK